MLFCDFECIIAWVLKTRGGGGGGGLFFRFMMTRLERHVSYHRKFAYLFNNLFMQPMNKSTKAPHCRGTHRCYNLPCFATSVIWGFCLYARFTSNGIQDISKNLFHSGNKLLLVEQTTFSKWCLFTCVAEHKCNHAATFYCFSVDRYPVTTKRHVSQEAELLWLFQ